MLKINEIFGPTIQGEGKNIGKPCMFIRTAGCNLQCTWCDSKYAWDFSKDSPYDPKKEIKDMTATQIYQELYELAPYVKHIVITGGEPLLQQMAMIPLLTILRENGYTIEIETNGTLEPSIELCRLVEQFNCSPKLKHSGNTQAIVDDALRRFADIRDCYFKFVVCNDEDMSEVLDLVNFYNIPSHRVYLMALGKTQRELAITSDRVVKMCAKHQFLFSPRAHIDLWGSKRGV